MKEIYDKVSIETSKLTTKAYSTSFSLGIKFLHQEIQEPVYSIYGFVRLGDEIVDTFASYDKEWLLNKFKSDVQLAIDNKISLNPILNSFQQTVHKYNIGLDLIDQFIHSMEMDLTNSSYDQDRYEEYILGSAEVVGLMCLKVFCDGKDELYQELKPYAMKLGSAYQKINFLRDLHADYETLGRSYFPEVSIEEFDDEIKNKILVDIEKDFRYGFTGVKKLPRVARFGVYMSYIYYYGLFNKIKKTPSAVIKKRRVRISNKRKYAMLLSSAMKYKLNLM